MKPREKFLGIGFCDMSHCDCTYLREEEEEEEEDYAGTWSRVQVLLRSLLARRFLLFMLLSRA